MAMYNYFIERVKANLHVVLAMSPIGDSFRNRLRMFPSLINCCTIDWFTAWPEDALEMVARKFLEEIQLDANVKRECIAVCKYFHEYIRNMSERYVGNRSHALMNSAALEYLRVLLDTTRSWTDTTT